MNCIEALSKAMVESTMGPMGTQKDYEMASQLQMIFEPISEVFGPIFVALIIASFYYETLYCYHIFMSGLTLTEIIEEGEKVKNNLKGILEIEKKEPGDEALELVIIDKKEETIKIEVEK